MSILLAVSPALAAAPPTRSEYVDRADVICERAADTVTPILEVGVKQMKANDVRKAGPKFVRSANIYEAARLNVGKIPKPAEDAKELTEWVKQVGVQTSFLRKTGEALSDAQRVKAQGYLSRWVHNGNQANDMVLGYGFKSCLFTNRAK